MHHWVYFAQTTKATPNTTPSTMRSFPPTPMPNTPKTSSSARDSIVPAMSENSILLGIQFL